MNNLSKNIERIINNLDKGFYYVDKERKIQLWSRKAEEITGYTFEEVFNKCNVLDHVNEEGETLCGEACPIHLAFENHSKQEKKIFLHRKDGNKIPVSVKVVPILDSSGITVGAIEIFDKVFDY